MRTSISDFPAYRAFCANAGSGDEVFRTFREHPTFKGIVEHVNAETGRQCHAIISENAPILWYYLEKFQSSERVGLSGRADLGLTPTTLRYIKVLSELVKHFGFLNDLRIAEIGDGYGGQCKIIHDAFLPANYTLIDLPEPLALARRFLKVFNVPNLRFLTMEELVPEFYDLVISNYALSECHPSIRASYLNCVIAFARRGYLAVNFIGGASGIDDMKPDEIQAIHPDMVDLPEDPPHPSNRLYLWGISHEQD
jgi:hypothetical protein